MFPETAKLLSYELAPFKYESLAINLGSGVESYWRHSQPWIYQDVMSPLMDESLLFNVDRKADDPQIPGLIHVKADAADVPLSSHFADIVLCTSLLEHTEQPEEILQEAFRLLKPQGIAYFEVPANYPEHLDPIDTGLRMHSPEQWRKLLGESWDMDEFWPIRSTVKQGTCTVVRARPR